MVKKIVKKIYSQIFFGEEIWGLGDEERWLGWVGLGRRFWWDEEWTTFGHPSCPPGSTTKGRVQEKLSFSYTNTLGGGGAFQMTRHPSGDSILLRITRCAVVHDLHQLLKAIYLNVVVTEWVLSNLQRNKLKTNQQTNRTTEEESFYVNTIGAIHKVCHANFINFWPPFPLSLTVIKSTHSSPVSCHNLVKKIIDKSQ